MKKFQAPRYYSDWRIDKFGTIYRSPKNIGRANDAVAILEGAKDYKLVWKYIYDKKRSKLNRPNR